MKEEFDFESIKNKAIEQLKAGKPLLGKDGAFAPLLEVFRQPIPVLLPGSDNDRILFTPFFIQL